VTQGNLEFVQVIVSMAVILPALSAVIVLDERRLRGKSLERSWPAASRDAAVFAVFNFTALVLVVPLIHFVRTRRNLKGVLLGVGWTAAILLVDVAAETGVTEAVDLLGL
jgi:hypothetical protein